MSALSGKKMIIASGPTFAPIDAVRSITNRSTGRLGCAIANALIRAGADVLFLQGETSASPLNPFPDTREDCICVESFYTVQDLKQLLQKHIESGQFDAVIMAAAVLDYIPEPCQGKKSSNDEQWTVTFHRGEKLIERIRDWSPSITIVGFKLESQISMPDLTVRALNLMQRSGAEIVVANRVEEVGDHAHIAYIIQKDDTHVSVTSPLPSREDIADALATQLALRLNQKEKRRGGQ
jgi:phosphopantothenoylcysteine synthetase/decarboxylase